MRYVLILMTSLIIAVSAAAAESQWDLGKKAVGEAAAGKLQKEINNKLLAESRKNQCSFKTDSDELVPGCEPKIKRLVNAILDAKKRIDAAGVQNFKFEIACYTDTRGNQEHNRQLTGRRAAVIANLLASHGIPRSWLIAVGRGSERPIVKPDNTPAKQAKNRRYEVQVNL